MTGVELPWSSSLIFQRTLSLPLHLSGTSFSSQWPCPVGPRQPGQLPASAMALQATKMVSVPISRFMTFSLFRGRGSTAHHLELDGDVAARGVGVGADLLVR